MRVALIQFAADVDPAANLSYLDRVLEDLEPGIDLVVLPEASMRDFGPPGDELGPDAQPLDGPFVQQLSAHARRLCATVVAGMFERTADSRPFNTLVVLGPDGALRASYRKIHLYDSFGYKESDRLLPGEIAPVIIKVGGARLGLMTCYDLRFPEMARLLVDAGADGLVVPAAWVAGEGKLHHWRTLLLARAIENTVPVIAAAQCGRRYTGHSLVADAGGTIVVEADNDPVSLTAGLDLARTREIRATNPSLENRRIGRGQT